MTAPGTIRYATSRDGTRIAWTSHGAGPSLVFVPPWATTIEVPFWWDLIRRVWAGRIVSYDRRGFGCSDWGVEHSLDRYADDLEAVADAAGIDRMTLYAAAAGGFDSVTLAARTPRVVRILLVEPVLRADPDQFTAQRSLFAILDHDFATFWRAFLQFGYGWGQQVDIDRLARYFVSATNPADVRALIHLLYEVADLSPFAPLVQAECLLIHNAGDSLMAPSTAAELARLIPRSRLAITSGPRWDSGEPGRREVQRFLHGERETGGTGTRRNGNGTVPVTLELGALTRRELEILEHLLTGATNEEIAAALTISPATVARHLANVYAKLGVRNRVEATVWGSQHVPRPVA